MLALMLAGPVLLSQPVHAQDSTSVVPTGEAFLEQLQPRDSVLVADQLRYGFELKDVKEGTDFMFPDYSEGFCPGVEIVSPWSLDTVEVHKGRRKAPSKLDIRGSVTITSFDEGKYELPPVYIVRISPDGVADTLAFAPKVLDVRTMPVDTASFQIHDIKGQIQYPVEFREVFPYLAGAVVLLLVILAALAFLGYRYSAIEGATPVDAPIFQQFNPFFVVALTPVSMAIFGSLARKGKEPSAPRKIGLGMLVAACGYILMMFASFGLLTPNAQGVALEAGTASFVSPNWLVSTYLVLTFGELLLSPMGISFVSKVAPPKYKGMMMGGWFVATAIGNYLTAVAAWLWGDLPLWVVWGVLVALCLLSALFIFSIMKRLERVAK